MPCVARTHALGAQLYQCRQNQAAPPQLQAEIIEKIGLVLAHRRVKGFSGFSWISSFLLAALLE
jgi:hypothetical protein